MTDGMAGLPFANDIIDYLKSNWTSSGGKAPIITTKLKKKAVGVDARVYDEVSVELDTEDPKI